MSAKQARLLTELFGQCLQIQETGCRCYGQQVQHTAIPALNLTLTTAAYESRG